MTPATPTASVDPTQPVEVLEGKTVTLAYVKALLEREREEREASGEELSYEQKLSLDHSSNFARLPVDQANTLLGKLLATGKVTEAQAVRIVDLAPMHADDVRAIFAKDRMQLENDDINNILDLVRGYVG